MSPVLEPKEIEGVLRRTRCGVNCVQPARESGQPVAEARRAEPTGRPDHRRVGGQIRQGRRAGVNQIPNPKGCHGCPEIGDQGPYRVELRRVGLRARPRRRRSDRRARLRPSFRAHEGVRCTPAVGLGWFATVVLIPFVFSGTRTSRIIRSTTTIDASVPLRSVKQTCSSSSRRSIRNETFL